MTPTPRSDALPAPQRLIAGDAVYPRLPYWPPAVPLPAELTVSGEPALLTRPLLAFLCSRRAPGGVVIAVHDWARAARDAGVPVVSGFQSPLERDALRFLLRGEQPVVICPARGIGGYRLPAEWREPLRQGRLAVVSPFADRQRRITAELAAERNRFVAAVAERVLIAHATPGGALAGLAAEVAGWSKPLFTFDDPANEPLRSAGARECRQALAE
jgi:predicted Rossmann fold nucleotide-binding protein DprA/Smf involved in DNA uptake